MIGNKNKAVIQILNDGFVLFHTIISGTYFHLTDLPFEVVLPMVRIYKFTNGRKISNTGSRKIYLRSPKCFADLLRMISWRIKRIRSKVAVAITVIKFPTTNDKIIAA